MLLAIPRGSPITYFGRTGSSGTVVIGGVRRINERCVGSATDKRSEGGVSISQAWSRRRRQVFDAVTVRATAADDVEQEEVVDKEEDAHEEAASSSREAPKISRFEQQQQRRTSKVRKQAGPRNPVGIFSNLVEEWTTFTSKREKGDIRDVILMSLSFAGSVVAVQKPYTAVMIVPTGTGASIGGFAGDSLPVARAMASVADCLITHPNVLNGAMLYWPMPNALYVEGYALDKFAEGSWGLQPVHQNRVGLVLDAGMEEEMRARHLQVADAACATLGLPMLEYTVTDMPLQVEKWVDSSGASTGRLGRPDSLMRAVNNLVKGGEVDAVAVVARFPDDSCEELVDYRQGKGVDVLAGVEAIISHMVVQEFQIPCAHAPALALLPFDQTISPRSAAEEIGFTFLPCVLVGLSRAPQYVSKVEFLRGGTSPTFWASDVDCVVVPFNACGGAGTLAFAKMAKHKPLILAVEENETVLNDTPEKLKLDAMRVANYWEALGVMAAHKAGVDPQALRRNGVSHLRRAHISSTSADVFPRSVLVAR